MPVKSIEGQFGFVTGAASGLGLGTVRHLLDHGVAGIITFDMNSLPDDLGTNARVVETNGDVSSEVDVKRAFSICEQTYGRLDFVVHCAGCTTFAPLYDFENNQPMSMEFFQRIVSVNLTGTFNILRLSTELLKNNVQDNDGLRGAIVLTSSICATDCPAKNLPYNASKAAINAMTLTAARELKVKGIRVAAISPGAFLTGMSAANQETREKTKEKLLAPKRYGQPEEFAHLVKHVLENVMLNGCVIRIDAGLRVA